MKRIVLSIVVFLYTCLVHGQVTSTIAAGNWDTPGNWSNGVPADGGTAVVNHEMTLDKDLTINDGNYTVNDAGKIIDPVGGSDYNIDVRGSGYLEISGTVTVGGDIEIRNSGEFILKGCDTVTVGGDMDFRNFSTVTVEACAVLIVEDDLNLRNDNATTIDGNVTVGGDLTSRNSSFIVGTGNIETEGETEIRNSSSIFGSTTDCGGPCEYGSGVGLPIELLSFDANYIAKDKIEINWETFSEINNNYFTLEYTTDGENFVEITKMEGAGNSQTIQQYRYVFEYTSEEVVYLRLTQTDFDGAQETFDLIAISPWEGNKVSQMNGLKIETFPNPTQQGEIILNAQLKGGVEQRSILMLHRLDGTLMFQRTYETSALDNGIRIEEDRVRSLSKGIYIISVLNGGQKSSEKYVVM